MISVSKAEKRIKIALSSSIIMLNNSKAADLILKHGTICGGAITSAMMNSRINDLDLYMDSRETLEELLKIVAPDINYRKIRNRNAVAFELSEKSTANAITHMNFDICGDYGKPKDICEAYDLHQNMAAFSPRTDKITFYGRCEEALRNKKLIFNKHFYNISPKNIMRYIKYAKRGWQVGYPEVIKLFIIIQKAPKVTRDNIEEKLGFSIKDIEGEIEW
jgi:hypothetical protein